MAQIVTITNPLTGQPAQVDQLEHTAQQIDDAIARALPGGGIDTALQNKAPAGFGLGTFSSPEIDDCDTATKNGWYRVKGATLNKPFNKVGALLVACRASTQMYQLFFVGETYDTGGSCIIVRSMYGGEWGPWEWVNPPMKLGVEYRTTERYLGKPVYVKVVDFGAGANNTEKSVEHGASNAIVIDYGGYAQNPRGALSIPWINHSTLSVSNTVIVMTADANYSGYSVYVWIKYYKTTD